MNKIMIGSLVKSERLRSRIVDRARVKSLIKSAEINSKIVKSIKLNDESATVVFRELYESIRQLGEAKWLLAGYEPLDHDVALEILKEIQIRNSVKLNYLGRFKKIRHDANYRGFIVSLAQAKEIVDFWDAVSKEIIKCLSEELNK